MTTVGGTSTAAPAHVGTLVARLRAAVADDLSEAAGHELSEEDRRELARTIVLERLHRLAAELVEVGQAALDPDEERRVAHAVLDALFGLGRLQALIDHPDVENIDVNGCDRVWITYADGIKAVSDPVADSDEELVEMLRSAAARFGLSERRFDLSHPELDLRLPDGSRLSALMSVSKRPAISIRRHRFVDLDLDDLVEMGGLDPVVASFLGAAVRARKNIVVGGAMNAGKTTLVRALASAIPPRERIVTIEQAFELGLDALTERHPDLVALEARPANAEGEGAISMARLVRRALRMNADRVIVGEVLGDEVLPMLNAMSQGRSGSMCTIHADSSLGIFRRLASYAVQAPERLPLESTNLLIAGAVHFAVFIDAVDEVDPDRHAVSQRLGMDAFQLLEGRPFEALKRRRIVASIQEVVGAEGLHVVANEVFRRDWSGSVQPGSPLRSTTLDELVRHGYEPSRRGEATVGW
ncbi:MAG TPA: ATPase, T2SS/T4P/T4SS family [Acidimicrobiales bacterium]|nr:ATPase, T2SS/T4P/T4SS family [Acidimicrobiales bacterium]